MRIAAATAAAAAAAALDVRMIIVVKNASGVIDGFIMAVHSVTGIVDLGIAQQSVKQ